MDEPKRDKRLPSIKIELDFYRTKKTGRLGTWKSIAHHPLHKLSTQGWIIKQTGFPCLVLVWNLAMLCDLYIPCLTTDNEKNVKLLMKAKETILDEPVQTEILWEDATLHSLKLFTKVFVTFTMEFYWDHGS